MPGTLETAVTAHGWNRAGRSADHTGAPIIHNWEHSADAEDVDARRALPTAENEVVVFTDAVPVLNQLIWSEIPVCLPRF